MMRKSLFTILTAIIATVICRADAPTGYYDSCEGYTGEQLLIKLYNTITTHTNVEYNGLWELYKTADVDANNKIIDIYSTKRWAPGTEGCNNISSGNHIGICYNREHSFPKSWFKEAQPMYADAFHIYPSDAYVNTQRSNYPYGECANGVQVSDYDGYRPLGKLGTCTFPGYTGKVFEPDDEYKGDLARAYFYMATCYYDRTANWKQYGSEMIEANNYPLFTSWAQALLLKWHRQDPVSERELDRQEAVYARQNNRNPYIDHPELVEYIWGDKIGDPWSESIENTSILNRPVNGSTIDFGKVLVGQTATVSVPVLGTDLTRNVSIEVSSDTFVAQGTEEAFVYDFTNPSSLDPAPAQFEQLFNLDGRTYYAGINREVSMVESKGSETTDGRLYVETNGDIYLRLYEGNTTKFTTTRGLITRMEISATDANLYGGVECNYGRMSDNCTTWTGASSEVTFTWHKYAKSATVSANNTPKIAAITVYITTGVAQQPSNAPIARAAETVEYECISDAADLSDGDEVIVVTSSGGNYYAMKAANSNNAVSVSVSDGIISNINGATVFTLKASGTSTSPWALYDSATEKYIGNSSGSNALNTYQSLQQGARFTYTPSADLNTMVFDGSSKKYLLYNKNSTLFRIYGSQTDAKTYFKPLIYRKKSAQQPPIEDTVDEPTFSLVDGEYDAGTSVSITCATEGATISYSINDGTTIDAPSPVTLTIDEDMIIEAMAYKGSVTSDVVTATYTVKSTQTTEPEDPEQPEEDEITFNLYKVWDNADAQTDISTSYGDRYIKFPEVSITLNACKVSQTITDYPVTKGASPMIITMSQGYYPLTSAVITFVQWDTKTNTPSLLASSDGANFTPVNATWRDFTLTATTLPADTKALRVTFQSSSNQIGIAGITVTYIKPSESGGGEEEQPDTSAAFTCPTTSITAATANAGTTIDVTFAPTASGYYTGTLTVRSGSQTSTVHLIGEGVDTFTALEPVAVDHESFVARWVKVGNGSTDYMLYVCREGECIDGYPVNVTSTARGYRVEGLSEDTEYTYYLTLGDITTDAVTVHTLAEPPSVEVSVDEILMPDSYKHIYAGANFLHIGANTTRPSEVVTLMLYASKLYGDMEVEVDAPFELSTDLTTWTQTVAIDANEDHVYVRLNSTEKGQYNSSVTVRAGFTPSAAEAPARRAVMRNGVAGEWSYVNDDFTLEGDVNDDIVTSVEAAEITSPWEAYCADGQLVLVNNTDAPIALGIYTIDGMTLGYVTVMPGEMRIDVTAGDYLIATASAARRVMVK